MRKGLTLIELILYVSLSAILLLVISTFLIVILESRTKNQVISEVEQQGLFVMQTITQTIRNAVSINSPTISGSASSISLTVNDALKNPTLFDLSNGAIRIKEGVGNYVNLTNNLIAASNLNFYNLSRLNTKGTAKILFTLTYVNGSGRNEYNYSKTFYGSASIR